jgi:glycosyltransferase involved in cell wall biosynthesis
VAIKAVDLDLSRPDELPLASTRYERVRLLVRVLGQPIGSVDVPNDPRDLQLSALRSMLAAGLGPQIWALLASRVWTSGQDDPSPSAISVIVCTRNRPDYLESCLAALALQRYLTYEVIVVDNAPVDSLSRDVAERHRVRYVVEPRPGLDWARNRGLAEARYGLVAFTDDDAFPDPQWLAELSAGFVAEEVTAVTGLVAPAEIETTAQALFENMYGGMGKGFDVRVFSRRRLPMHYRPHEYGVGCNMAFRKMALQQLGGFDPALDTGTPTGGGGDLDAFQRIIEAGQAIVYRPDAIVRHTHRRTVHELRGQLYDNGRGYSAAFCAAFLRARGRERLRVALSAWSWLWHWHVRRIARRIRGRENLPLRLILAESSGAIAGPFYYIASRRRAQKLARSPA